MTNKLWFRWALVAGFLVAMFSLSLVSGSPPQTQTYEEPEHSAQSVKVPISADERLADYTEALAIFTALLAAVSTLQIWLLMRADNASRRVLNLSEKQFLLEGRQADLAEKQHGLARLQHISLNRPIIEIRSVGLANSGIGAILFLPGFPVRGSLVIRNAGGSDAIILETEYRFFWSHHGLPMVPPLQGQPTAQTSPLIAAEEIPFTLIPHASHLVSVESSEVLGGDAVTIDNAPMTQRTKLWILGSIRYADSAGNERWMGFCREYVPAEAGAGEGSFLPIRSPDYEYQD